MTTIVFDGTILAADSQTTAPAEGACPHCKEKVPYLERNNPHKLRTPRNAKFKGHRITAFVGAGHVQIIRACSTALVSEVDLKVAMDIYMGPSGNPSGKKLHADCTMLILTTEQWWVVEIMEGKVTVTEKHETDLPLILGSGSPAAQLAIKRLGFNAIGALAAAIDADAYSGGEISYIDFSEETPTVKQYLWTEEDTVELFNETLKEPQ